MDFGCNILITYYTYWKKWCNRHLNCLKLMIATRTVTLTEFVPLIFSPPDNSIALQKTFPCLGAPYNLQQHSDISTTPKLSNYSLYFFSHFSDLPTVQDRV